MVFRFTSVILRHRVAALTAILIASEAVYLLAFVRPYALLRYWNVPLLDLGKIAQRNPGWAAEFVGAFLALFALYALAVWLCGARQPGPSQDGGLQSGDTWTLIIVVVVGTLVLSGTLMTVYPIGAGDVFDYVVHGILLARYHVSPHVAVGASFPQEPLVSFSGWRHYPSYYGPLWSWLEAAVDLAAGPQNLLANLLGFKVLAIAGLLCCVWLIARITAWRAPDRVLPGLVFFAWNPLALYEAAANAHNDFVMLAFVLAAFLAWQRRRWVWAVTAMTLAVLIKVPPLPLLGLLGVAVVAQAPGWAAKLYRAAMAAMMVVAVAGMAYLTLPQGLPSVLTLRSRADLFTHSLPTVVVLLLRFVAPRATAESLTRVAALFAFEVAVAWKAWQTWQKPERLPRASFEAVTFLLLFATLWFQPWYTLWLVALAAILGNTEGASSAQKLAGLFSLAVTWAYVVYGFAWFWFAPQMNWGNALGVQATGFIVTYTLPLAYLIGRAWRRRRPQGRLVGEKGAFVQVG